MATHGTVFMAGQIIGPVPPLPPGQLLYYTPQPHPHARVTWTPIPPTPSQLFHESGWKPSLDHFHYFPNLPIELRLRIWSFAAFPRVIELRSWGNTDRNPYTPIKFSTTPHRPPVLLQINSESRREALRIYQRVKIGVSASVYDSHRTYINWRSHPHNPNTPATFNRQRTDYPLARPYPPIEIYLSYSLDTIYLGPEFQTQHLQSFLCTKDIGFELAGLQYLALDRKLWIGTPQGRWEYLRNALYSLNMRPLKELYVVPDDEFWCLEDRWYYKEHEIELSEPVWNYKFRPAGQAELAKTAVENLGLWFERLWKESGGGSGVKDGSGDVDVDVDKSGNGGGSGNGRETPKVDIRSVRRNGRRMGDFKEGMWEVQKMLGDMRDWNTWLPAQN